MKNQKQHYYKEHPPSLSATICLISGKQIFAHQKKLHLFVTFVSVALYTSQKQKGNKNSISWIPVLLISNHSINMDTHMPPELEEPAQLA